MITNILLGLILGVVITSFIILNNNIIKLYKLFNTLVNRLNYLVSVDNEYFEIIKDLIDKNKVEIYNTQQILYNLPVRLETFIAEENDTIRNEIKKKAKISSKKKSQSKTNKSINKQ